MALCKESVEALSDLIENRLAMMTIHDQDDLREKMRLQRAMTELHDAMGTASGRSALDDIPRRGRRRKIGVALRESA